MAAPPDSLDSIALRRLLIAASFFSAACEGKGA